MLILGAALFCIAAATLAQTSPKPASKTTAAPVATVKLNDSRFALLTGFSPIGGDKENIILIALAKYTIDAKKGYALLLENHVKDFRFDLIDTTGLYLQMNTYILRQLTARKISWMEESSVLLRRMNVLPSSDSKGIVVAFPLTDEEMGDLKKELISSLFIINEGIAANGNLIQSSSQYRVDEPVKSMFVKNVAKIPVNKTRFADVSRFKTNKIPFYSLMNKSEEDIVKRLGESVKQVNLLFSGVFFKFYETADAEYQISYEKNISNRITMTPKFKLKYSEYSFYTDVNGYPFELTGCNCGEFIVEQSEAGVDYTYRDKRKHQIRFSREHQGRFLNPYLAEISVND